MFSQGMNLMHAAAHVGNLHCVLVLAGLGVSRDDDVLATTSIVHLRGMSAVSIAASHGHDDLVEFFASCSVNEVCAYM